MSAPVLAAYDPVARDLAPVRVANAVAGVMGTSLVIATVHASAADVDLLAGGQMGEGLPADDGGAADEAARALPAGGPSVETVVLSATSVPRALQLAAAELGPGLIVVGSRAAAEPGRLDPGGTALRMLDGCACAVAVVPGGWDGAAAPATIGAGVVPSPEGHAAVRSAHALAGRSGATLRALAAVLPRPWMPDDDEEPLAERLRTLAEEAAAAAVPAAAGVRTDVDVVVADPAEALLAASAELDLLVCGSRCYGPPACTLLGGVTRRVLREARCPVLVTARAPRVALEALAG